LFGVGLKKNAVYDLMNNNQVDKINRSQSFNGIRFAASRTILNGSVQKACRS